jgi:hypothetical protein
MRSICDDESIRRTIEYASDITEVVLNLTIESILVQENNPQ